MNTTKISIDDAEALLISLYQSVGHTEEQARIAAGQVVDIELRGAHFGGFSRALSMCQLVANAEPPAPIRISNETPVSAVVNGGRNLGYLVAHRATEIAIEKAKKSGIGMAGGHDTFFTGQFSYYMEMCTRQGLIGIAVGSSRPQVAPHGATESIFGTNPIAFGFPTEEDPLIVDIGTSSVMVGDLLLWGRTDRKVPDGAAFGRDGRYTDDPTEALAGAIAVWGGHKGSGIALAVQLLGTLAGGSPDSSDMRKSGYFIIVIDPKVMGDAAEYKKTITEYLNRFTSLRPEDPANPVRLPFSRSANERRRQLGRGYIEVPMNILCQIQDVVAGRKPDHSVLSSIREQTFVEG